MIYVLNSWHTLNPKLDLINSITIMVEFLEVYAILYRKIQLSVPWPRRETKIADDLSTIAYRRRNDQLTAVSLLLIIKVLHFH